jgi:hypothetical protein
MATKDDIILLSQGLANCADYAGGYPDTTRMVDAEVNSIIDILTRLLATQKYLRTISEDLIQNRATAVPFNTIHVAQRAGIHKVTFYLVVVTAGTLGTMGVNIRWNDTVSTKTFALATGIAVTPIGLHISATRDIFVGNGQNIDVQVTFTGVTGPLTYHLAYKVETS